MLNHITIMGRLTRDPELRYTQSQIPVASFTVACERDIEQNGQRETDFIDCVAWRRGGEFVSTYFRKGSMIVVDGRLQSRKWQDRDGNNRNSWEINADRCYFGERARESQDRPAGAQNPYTKRGYGDPNVYPDPQDRFTDMPGSGGAENPFAGRQETAPSAYQQAGMWDDLNDGELPF